MPLLIVTKPFKFAHHGIHVEEFAPSKEPIQLTDECAEVALAEGWAKEPRAQRAPISTKPDPTPVETLSAQPEIEAKSAEPAAAEAQPALLDADLPAATE